MALRCAAAAVAAAVAVAAATPNLVVLLADDMGHGDLQPPLGASPALTPNLAAWAASPHAAHFPRFYSGGPVCSPTRATVLTGRSNSRDCVINVEQMALPLQLAGRTLADYARRAGFATGFFGKWHLGSMTNDTTPESCYPAAATNGTCLPGYLPQSAKDPITCCSGREGRLVQRTPLDFGFEAAWATAEVAPSSTSNCGCTRTVAGAGTGCNLGHYAGAGHTPAWMPGLECDPTWYTPAPGGWAPYPNVTAEDDAGQLVDRLEGFMRAAVAAGRPFVAQVSFHMVHIPYVSAPAFRALYPDADANHADYYGALSGMDAAVGRVRALLAELGVANDTLLVFTSDNGPEVDDARGHSTAPFVNPGTTGGLAGRKRALLEGGIRVPGLVEAPFLVGGRGPLTLPRYAAVTTDLLPTFLELAGLAPVAPPWPLDGVSLVGALTAADPGNATRPAPAGWLSNFTLEAGNATCPPGPPVLPPSAGGVFSTPAHQAQAAWAEGPLTLVACRNAAGHWVFRLYDVDADPGQTTDLFARELPTADAMFGRLRAWLASVAASRANETRCDAQP